MFENSLIKMGFTLRQLPMKVLALLVTTFILAGCESPRFPDLSQPAAQHHSDKILLSEGDVLKITFPSSPDLDSTSTIQRDGKISLPLVGEVEAAGMTPDQLQQNLVKLFASQIASKEVTVAVVQSSFPIYMTGYVMRPGKILSNQPITALEAVMEVGIDYSTANLKAVKVIRRENGVSHIYILNLKRILNGKDSKPFYLQPADVVYVPEKFDLF
ncbi:MAG TPA: polysaccharide biosynthesis/export family protein [Verrucomicrobiae bacterium]|nr:polysaccharide biosynthesis/export family protein [Verrucomicrobiae bacterium]